MLREIELRGFRLHSADKTDLLTELGAEEPSPKRKTSYDRINDADPHERSGGGEELRCRPGEGASRHRGRGRTRSPSSSGAFPRVSSSPQNLGSAGAHTAELRCQ